MKAKKFLALVLALIMALSCMSLTALAVTKDCPTCNGTGEIACTNEDCVAGRIPTKNVSPDPSDNDDCEDCEYGVSVCPTCKGAKEVEVFSEDFTVTIPEITVGSKAEEIKNGIKFADPEIAEDIEVFNFELVSFDGEDPTSVESVNTAGPYGIFVVFQFTSKSAYTSFGELEGWPGVYAKTVTFNGENEFDCIISTTGNEYNSDNHTVSYETSKPCIYLDSIQTFVITENDGNNDYDAILDLEESTDYPDHITIDQLYDVTVTENQTDVTKVQVSWELSNIQASVTSNKIWDTKNLEWVDDTNKPNGATATNGTAKFTFVNLSSVKMDAEVTFAVAEGFTPVTPEFSNSKITLGTKADGEKVENNGEITVTVTPNAEDFATLTEDATNVKYGTYTVTIGKTPVYKLKKGDLIYMNLTAAEGNEMYRVIKVDGTKVELLAMEDGEVNMAYNANHTKVDFGGGKMGQQYAGSDLDKYLNKTWFNNLSDTAQKAIVAKEITQDMWTSDAPHTITSDKSAEIGERNVYALSMSEVQEYLNGMSLNNNDDTMKTAILNMFYSDGVAHDGSNPWLRSAYANLSDRAWYVYGNYGYLDYSSVGSNFAARPALTIDLSKMGADCWSYVNN